MDILQKARKVEKLSDELRHMYFLLCRLKKSDKKNISEVETKIQKLTIQLANELVNSKSEIEKMLNIESEDK